MIVNALSTTWAEGEEVHAGEEHPMEVEVMVHPLDVAVLVAVATTVVLMR
jgi:hypothetical protein